jgi:hypothetical protein
MKVKSSLVGNEQPTPKIDWSKPQLLVSKETKAIILSQGECDADRFSGTLLVKNESPSDVGYYSSDWKKVNFELVPNLYQVILQNSND